MKHTRAQVKETGVKMTWKEQVLENVVIPAIGVLAACLVILYIVLFWHDDESRAREQVSASGVKRLVLAAPRGSDGLTVEQRNIKQRLEQNNRPGATQHYYIMSPVSGQIVSYSTVRGKVTSSGKRLSPYSTSVLYRPTARRGGRDENSGFSDFRWVGGYQLSDDQLTREALQADGAYGASSPFVFWWDVNDVYHQHFVTDGQIVIVRSHPLPRIPQVELRPAGADPRETARQGDG